MPIPNQRTPQSFALAMEPWLVSKLELPPSVRVQHLRQPQGVGNSNETLLFDAVWTADGQQHARGLVVRVAPTGFPMMLDADFAATVKLQHALADRGCVRTPRILHFEDSSAMLGAPFCVMDRIEGRTPTDNPPYNAPESWIAALPETERRRLWINAVTAFADLHRPTTDLASLLPALPAGRSGAEDRLRYLDRFQVWANDGLVHPFALAARDWLHANLPANAPTAFSWGDARMENMMFGADQQCVALLDWELVSLAGPLADLGWWLFMDRHACLTGGRGFTRLPGLGDRAETLALWQELTAIPVDDLLWYEVLAGYQMLAMITRLVALAKTTGMPLRFNPLHTASVAMVRDLLDLPPLATITEFVRWDG